MNGNWLATVQTLGLDIMLSAIVVLLVLNAAEPVFQRWRERVRARERQAVARGPVPQVQQATGVDTNPAEVAESGRRSRRPEWLVGAFKGLPTQYDKTSPGAHPEESTTPPGRRAA
jgi:hypothetical protein